MILISCELVFTFISVSIIEEKSCRHKRVIGNPIDQLNSTISNIDPCMSISKKKQGEFGALIDSIM